MLNLQDLAKQGEYTKKVVIEERLPSFLKDACHLSVVYQVEAKDNFYLIHLKVSGNLNITCQRCMHDFTLAYDNPTTIAVCRTDERAEELLEHYECIVSSNWQVDLNELICDELYLYVPQCHEEMSDCDNDINQFLTRKIEAY